MEVVALKYSFLGFCHVRVLYMELFSIFSRFLQKVVVFCFSESIFQKTTQQSDGGCNVTSDYKFNAKYSKKQTFLSSSANKKFIVSKEYCISYHDAGMWFLPICRTIKLLLGVVQELLHKLDPLCFHINMWTVSIHSTSIV